MNRVDVVVLGAGAAGMMCAAEAGKQGLSVLLIDHAKKIGEKIRISGGGRCNFTNERLDGHDGAPYFVSEQPRFVRHALAQYPADAFKALLAKHGVASHEKHKGQWFCDESAQQVVDVLKAECAAGKVRWHTECVIERVSALAGEGVDGFEVGTSKGVWRSRYVVVATGGLAVPAIGATGLGYELAKQFGHTVVTPEAALVPLKFEGWAEAGLGELAGLALPVVISTQQGKAKMAFEEDLLFRHQGLSGPAILQISSYWRKGQSLCVNLCPGVAMADALCAQKQGQKIQLDTAVAMLAPDLPKRLLQHWLASAEFEAYAKHKWADVPNQVLQALGRSLNEWVILPSGSDGHKKAEVTRGGVSVRELSSKTMASKRQAGLYFIGEVVDVTGWLGGYNFQWAWASAVCAAKAMAEA
ncbi:MAG: aminoacetone oxidase family FAD-binding enzyme [Neisseriaceae bacterium]|nr:aminoacetone oxidase family FAD-binding enzyme [Neisseriaceae bacterium]